LHLYILDTSRKPFTEFQSLTLMDIAFPNRNLGKRNSEQTIYWVSKFNFDGYCFPKSEFGKE